jgi:hypothetical protein
LDPAILKKYGLPTAFACACFAAMMWLMQFIVGDLGKKIENLRNDVNFVSGMVDYACAPAPQKPVHKPDVKHAATTNEVP